ncbi:MAG: response regulator [Fimbriimonas sp.]|nr:response regulator [Fimbriimonas sp.]
MNIGSNLFPDARIVVVDDLASNLRFIQMLLQLAGYTNVVCYTDSKLALQDLNSLGCDLALLDLQMPARICRCQDARACRQTDHLG